jgi:hypothetical protein
MFSLNWFFGLIPTWVPWLMILTGATLYLIETFFIVMVPIVYRVPVKILAIALFGFGFYVDGRIDVLIDAKQEVHEAKVQQVVVTKYIVKKYKEKRKKLNDDYAKIASSITTKDDHMCTLPESFVSVFDSAAKNSISSATERTDGTASGIELSTAEEVIVENYGLYHKVAEQLKALQKWVSDQKALNP